MKVRRNMLQNTAGEIAEYKKARNKARKLLEGERGNSRIIKFAKCKIVGVTRFFGGITEIKRSFQTRDTGFLKKQMDNLGIANT